VNAGSRGFLFLRGHGPFLLVLCFAAVIYGADLGDWALWQDEANAALLAKNILRDGLPTIFDGTNVLWPAPADVGRGHRLWIVWGWLPLYVNALFFKLFGVATLTARLPSAVMGVLFLAAFYATLLRLRFSRRAAVLAAGGMALLVPVALHVRQCGYYVYVLYLPFFFFAQIFFTPRGRKRTLGAVALSTALLNTHFLVWAATMAAAGAVRLARPRRIWRDLPLAAGLLLSAVPFLYLYEIQNFWTRAFGSAGGMGLPLKAAALAHFFNRSVFPWPYLLGLGVLYGFLRRRLSPVERALLTRGALFAGVSAVLLVLLPRSFFPRYALGAVPFLIAGTALLHARAFVWGRGPAAALLGVYLAAVVGVFQTTAPGRTPLLWRLAGELRREKTDINEEVARYLNAHAAPTDTVVCNYEEFPLMFYTPNPVRGGAGRVALTRHFPEYGISPVERPEWIVYRRHNDWEKLAGGKIREFLERFEYEAIPLPVADTQWGANREDPAHHHFATPAFERPFLLYRLKKGPGTVVKAGAKASLSALPAHRQVDKIVF